MGVSPALWPGQSYQRDATLMSKTAQLAPVYNPDLPWFGGGMGKELIT